VLAGTTKLVGVTTVVVVGEIGEDVDVGVVVEVVDGVVVEVVGTVGTPP
jgi:hypothetical protein